MYRRRTATIILTALSTAAACFAVAAPAQASTIGYYVAPTGSDANNGLSPQHPFQHIQQCADVAQPGDTCFIMAGSYHETVTPAHSGTATAPITYHAYDGQKVTIDGADPVESWRPVGPTDLAALTATDAMLADSNFAQAVQDGQMFSASLPIAAGLLGNQVFVDGQAANEAQWPDPGIDPFTPRIEYAQAGGSGTKIADPALNQPAGYWTGATAYTSYWYNVQTTAVTGSAPGSVTLASGPNLGLPAAQTRYYLFGTLKAFSHPGQWFYDAKAQTLYLWSPDGAAPSTHTIEVKQRTYAFDLTNASYTHIDAVDLNGATITTGDGTTGDVLTHLDAQYVSAFDTASTYIAGETNTGIVLRGSGNSLRDSSVVHSAGNGVLLTGDHNVVLDTVIHDVDSMGTYAAAVNVIGDNQTVAHNTIYRVGRVGINVDWHINGYVSHNNRFAYNDISGYSRLNVDSGAIYVCCTMDLAGSSIDHNWLHDATPMALVNPWAEAGVYLDGTSGGGTVEDNVGWNEAFGTVFMNSYGLATKVYDNDGGVKLYPGTLDPGTEVVNNTDSQVPATDSGGVLVSNNLPAGTDPGYADPAARDYRLAADSPARNAGAYVPGVTINYTDPKPSIGAYQYGAPFWSAGAPNAAGGLLFARAGSGAFTVAVGGTTRASLQATMSDGTLADLGTVAQISYQPTDPSVATVDPDGTVHGLRTGATTVTARAVLDGAAAVATFTVTVLPTTDTVPAGWTATNLGTDENGAPAGGFVSDDGGTYRIVTTGYNIWSAADGGTFLHNDLPGATNVTVTATIETKTAPPSGVGLMIRDGDSASAKEVSFRAQDDGLRLVFRNDQFPSTSYLTSAKPVLAVPVTLKLVKQGDTFTGYCLSGGAWVTMGGVDDVMGTDLEVGVGIYAGAYASGEATFDGLAVSGVSQVLAAGVVARAGRPPRSGLWWTDGVGQAFPGHLRLRGS